MRPTKMKVSMRALIGNAQALRNEIPDKVKMLCVVKADGYGHDALAFARELERQGIADAFAVAVAEEARVLRDGGIKSMIVILGDAREGSLREAVRLNASQAVDSEKALRILDDEAKKLGVIAKAHLKVDSGMSRIGVRSMQALEELLKAWKECPSVEMEGCFTHFCAAESDPDFTKEQNAAFERMLNRVREAGYRPIAHAAASSAMLNPAYHHDIDLPFS